MEKEERNILLCVLGFSPAIITETLWCLTQGYNSDKTEYKIDEIFIITTQKGKAKLDELLLTNGGFEQFKKDYPGCSDVKISHVYIVTNRPYRKPDVSDSKEIQLEDVRTGEENECAANQIYLILKDLIKESTRLHASAAGGRKTMGIYLSVMMQLLARAEDTLSHVVVWDEFESDKSFLYPKPELLKSNKPLPIALAFIPFIRLRETGKTLIERLTIAENSYSNAVQKIRENLKLAESGKKLVLKLKEMTANFGDFEIELTGKRVFLLLLYALYQKEHNGKFLADASITKEILNSTFMKLSSAVINREYSLDTVIEQLPNPKLEWALKFANEINDHLFKIRDKGATIREKHEYEKTFKKYMTDSRSDLKDSLSKVSDKICLQRKVIYGKTEFGFSIETDIV